MEEEEQWERANLLSLPLSAIQSLKVNNNNNNNLLGINNQAKAPITLNEMR